MNQINNMTQKEIVLEIARLEELDAKRELTTTSANRLMELKVALRTIRRASRF
jgi:hypothetical protein